MSLPINICASMRMARKVSFSVFLFVLISINAVVSSLRCIEPNSHYKNSTDKLLSFLSSNVMGPSGFYNASIVHDSNTTLYAVGMCITFTRSEPKVCSHCVEAASNELKSCSNYTKAYTWRSTHNALCFARFSNRFLLGKFDEGVDMHPLYMEYNSENINADPAYFEKEIWVPFTDSLVNNASEEKGPSFSSHIHYATGERVLTSFQTLYGLMQCTPDLSKVDCGICLRKSIKEYQTANITLWKQGGIVAWPKCFFRWDMQKFSGAFDDSGVSCSKKISTTVFVASIVPTAVISFVMAAVVLVLIFRMRKSNPPPDSPGPIPEFPVPPTISLQYDLRTIQAATCTFSESNMLGQGGFGEVYKGLLWDGSEIAVKRLSKKSAQGVLEFRNETSLVAKLQHRNLVGVLGFCMEGDEKILVYEFVPNKSLDQFLFDPPKQGQLDWAKRYKIIVGTARGIMYLHHDSPLRIIHRDLKASNILLDAEMEPKVADFGMARILRMDQSRADTRRVVGTHGYISPEYLMHGQFSRKSDVYSFGVIILEIISGKRNSNFHETDESGNNLVAHAWKHWRNGSPLELVDAKMGMNYQSYEVIRCIHIALLCVQNNPEVRPFVSAIVSMLTCDSVNLPLPQSPPLYEGMGLPPIKSVPVSIYDSLIDDLVPR